ncbi:MAG: hypothetical protein AUJ92_13455 [Armatimonadetes bacterium CG2_30_59_28]|nr:hypothetical protein [Armatimonadota bacterium]OIO92830.1 MAG: hypothetical protein AUJ92_13455 [Armatimonadetes bacterium CG2_30_59_28]
MTPLSGRERLLRVFRQQDVDRMPLRIWGVDPMFPSENPTWAPLCELTEDYQIDIFRTWNPTKDEWDPHLPPVLSEEVESDKPDMSVHQATMQTPSGPLTASWYRPKDGSPGYVKKHYIESIEDARKWLSIPASKPTRRRVDSYWELEQKSNDRALLFVGIGEAMYSVQAHMGSESFGLWLMDERDLLREMIDKAYAAVEEQVKYYLSQKIGDAYGWVGPELCIPPLASPKDFREFVFDYDKKIIDLIHDAGKLVWVHCHGDMNPVLEDFVEMGVDCLNPIEPPPTGKLTLAEAKKRCAGKMSLEGGVQNGDFDRMKPEQLVPVVEEVIRQGKPGGCFILCPTSSPSTRPRLNERHIANYRAFVEAGIRLGRYE